MKILAALLASCLSLSAAFPVFFGNQNNYISNEVASGTWKIVVNSEVIGYFDTNGITITNNNGITFAKTNNSTVAMITYQVSGVTVYDFLLSSNAFTIRDAVNGDPVIQYDLSKRLMTVANTAVQYRSDTLTATNFGSTVFHQDVTAAGWAKKIQTISGTGGANTNFTIQSTQAMVFINGGLTNVSVTIMGGETGRAWEGSFVCTNLTGTDRTLAFSAVSNNWRSVTHFDGVATNGETLTITNGTAVSVWWRIVGSNILYAAKHVSNPAN